MAAKRPSKKSCPPLAFGVNASELPQAPTLFRPQLVSGLLKHLQAYLNEFTFRFNRRFYPFNAFRSLLGIAGARLNVIDGRLTLIEKHTVLIQT